MASKTTKTAIAKTAIEMAIGFLSELSNRFSYDGCNDHEVPNTEENWEIFVRAVYASGDQWQISEIEKNGRPNKKQKMISCTNLDMVCGCKLYLEDLLKQDIDPLQLIKTA